MNVGLKLYDPKKVNKKLSQFGKSIDLTNRKSNLSVGVKNVALTPAAVPFAVGARVNQLTGGKTTTYNVWKAASGKAPAPTYSLATQALSGYQGATPGAGTWAVPVANRATTKGAGEVVKTVIEDVAKPAADAASDALFGVDLKTLAWVAAGTGAAVFLGPPLVGGIARAVR